MKNTMADLKFYEERQTLKLRGLKGWALNGAANPLPPAYGSGERCKLFSGVSGVKKIRHSFQHRDKSLCCLLLSLQFRWVWWLKSRVYGSTTVLPLTLSYKIKSFSLFESHKISVWDIYICDTCKINVKRITIEKKILNPLNDVPDKI